MKLLILLALFMMLVVGVILLFGFIIVKLINANRKHTKKQQKETV